MMKSEQELKATEKNSLANYKELIEAKKKQASVLRTSIEGKLQRSADTGVKISALSNDLENSQQSLAKNQAFTAALKVECTKRQDAHYKEKQLRADETIVVAQTIKILSDDDALDLFKKTLPGPGESLLQVAMTESSMPADA